MPRHKDEADWTDVAFESVDVGVRSEFGFEYIGYLYATEGELILAQLLDKQGISYTPDVRVEFEQLPKGRKKNKAKRKPKKAAYVPDFVFNGQAFIWTDPKTGEEELIHGLEAKAKKLKTRKTERLRSSRAIKIKTLNMKDIRFFLSLGSLPLRPYKKKRKKKK